MCRCVWMNTSENSQRMISFFVDSTLGVFFGGGWNGVNANFCPNCEPKQSDKQKGVTGNFGQPVTFLTLIEKKMICQPEVCLRHLGETPDDQISLANLG